MLFSALTALSFVFPSQSSQEVEIWAHANEHIELQVLFPKAEILLNREAPNTMTLITPWNKTTLKPNGKIHQDNKFHAYFSQVYPMKLKFKVPLNTALGQYQGQLKAQFFVCELQDQQCTKRILQTKVHIYVTAHKKSTRLTTLHLQEHDLRPMKLRPFQSQP